MSLLSVGSTDLPLSMPARRGDPPRDCGSVAGRGSLAADLDAHRSGGALDHPFAAASTSLADRSAILIAAISRTWSRVTRPMVSRFGVPEPLLVPAAFAEQVRGRWGLEDEGERAVLEDRDLGRDDLAGLVGGLLVVALGELDDVDAVRPQRRADRRRGRPCRRAAAA